MNILLSRHHERVSPSSSELARGLKDTLCTGTLDSTLIYYPLLLRAILRIPRFQRQLQDNIIPLVEAALERNCGEALTILLRHASSTGVLHLQKIENVALYVSASRQGFQDPRLERGIIACQRRFRTRRERLTRSPA